MSSQCFAKTVRWPLVTFTLLSVELNNVFVFIDKPHELYSAFSVYKNGAKLFDVGRKESSNILQSLPGLRTFAMLHIMLGHRFSWARGFPNVNSNMFAVDGKWMKTLFSAFVNIHPIAVDSFFVMGGLLLARSIFSNIERFEGIWVLLKSRNLTNREFVKAGIKHDFSNFFHIKTLLKLIIRNSEFYPF